MPRPLKGARGRLLAIVIGLGLVSVLATTASAAPKFSANASMTPKVQYLNDRTGTVFTFNVVNTGDTRFAAVEIARPSPSWIVRTCPRAPAGWTTQRHVWGCRYRSRPGAADDIRGHTSNSNFRVKATVRAGSDNIVGRWRVVVSRTTSFSNRANLRSAPPLSPGLRMVAYSFQVLDAVVVSSPRPIGSACPARTAANHSAITGATGLRIAICGRNRSNGPRTPNAGNSSLGGSFIASHGGFSSGSIRANSGNVVLGNWANVTITSSPGAGKSIAAKIGTRASRTSPLTPLGGYTAINQAPVAAATSAVTDEDIPSGPITLSASDANGDPMAFSIASGPAHGTLGAISAAACPSTAPAAHTCTATVVYTPAANYNGPDSFTYIATDVFGSASAPATVSLTVPPVNDNPVVNPATFTIPENSPNGTAVGTVTASDVDTGQTRSFSIEAGNTGGAFAINASSGAITVANSAALDFEATPSFALTVRATDNGSPVRNGEATVTVNLTDANDAPTVATSGGSAAYTENAAAVAIDPALTAADVDDSNLESAVVRISANFQAGDNLAFTNQLGIAGSYNSGTGVLTLTGTSSVANYQTALRSVGFSSTNDNPAVGRTVAFRVNDGSLDSTEATRGITIAPVNDAPTVTMTAESIDFTENGAAIAVDDNLTVADPDDTSLSGAQIRILFGFESGDFLLFTNQLGINGVYNIGTGVLTLSGNASVANYQTALRSIQYDTNDDDPSGPKSIGLTVNDGDVDSAEVTRIITITAVNDAPVVATTPGNLAVTEGDAATAIDGGLTVADVDDSNIESGQVRISAGFQAGDTLSFVDNLDITGSYNPGTGVLTLTGNDSLAGWQASLRTVAYSTTNDHPAVPKTVEFKVNDGDLDSNAATKGIDVTVVNDASTVTTTSTNLAYTEDEGAKVVDAGVTVTDPDSAELTSATVAITTGCAPADDVLALPSPPAGITVDPYNSATCTLTLHGSATTSLSNFQAALPLVTFTSSSQDPSGSKTVSFQVRDDFNAPSNVATRTIDLTPVNDAPMLSAIANPAAILEDAGEQNEPLAGISAGGGESQTLLVTAVSDNPGLIPNPTVTYTSPNATGSLAYTPALDQNGSAVITVTVDDDGGTANGGVDTFSQTFTVTVSAVNDAPVITAPASIGAQFDTNALVTGVSLADPDAAGDDVTFTVEAGLDADTLTFDLTVSGWVEGFEVVGNGTDFVTVNAPVSEINATLAASNGLVYHADPDFVGTTDTIDLDVNDQGNNGSGGALTDDATITVDFDEPPVVVTTETPTTPYTENAAAVAIDPALTVTDADDTNLESGRVRIAGGFDVGGDTLGFTDQNGITGSYNAATGILTLTGTSSVANYQTALRSVTFSTSHDNPATTKSIGFRVNDGDRDSIEVGHDVTVTRVNDAPIVAAGGSLTYTEGDGAVPVHPTVGVVDVDDSDLESATVSLAACSPGQDVLAFADTADITGSFDGGTCTLTLTGPASVFDFQMALRTVTYENGSDDPNTTSRTVTFQVDDGSLDGSDTRGIDIFATNDAPTDIALSDAFIAENEPGGTSVGTFSTTDPDSADTHTYELTTGAGDADNASFQVNGSSLDAVGSFDFETQSSYSIRVRTTDSGTGSLTHEEQFTITVTDANDAPTAIDLDVQDIDENLPVGTVIGTFTTTDPDAGDTFTYATIGGSPGDEDNDSFTISGNQLLSGEIFDFEARSPAVYSVRVQTTDSGGETFDWSFSITVNDVNDAPDGVADSYDAVGNTGLFVGSPTPPAGQAAKQISGSLLANDTDQDGDTLVIEPVSAQATTLGGTVTIEADGDFVYQPDDGDLGADTFTYHLCDVGTCDGTTPSGNEATVTATVALTGQVWYVHNLEPAGGDGTSDSPFDTLLEAEAASGSGDTVFAFAGTGTTFNMGGSNSYVMDTNERLLGEANGLTIDPDGGGPLALVPLYAATGNRPRMGDIGFDAITLASGAEVRGFDIDPNGNGGGIFGGAGVVGATIDNVHIEDTAFDGLATQPGLELNGTSGTFNVSNLEIDNSATGVLLVNAGTVNFLSAGTISINSTGAMGLDAFGTSLGADSVFDDITVTGSTAGGVNLTNTTGTTTFGDGIGTDLDLTTTSGSDPAFRLSSAGTVTVGAAGTDDISATGGAAIDVSSTTITSLAFDTVSSTSSAGKGINLSGLGTGTFSASGGSISGAAIISFDVDQGSGDITYPGNLNDGAGQAAEITSRSGGTVTLSGSIADTTDAGGGILLSGNSGGSTVFSGSTKTINTTTSGSPSQNNAIVMNTSDGHTLTFSNGSLDIDTTTGKGFEADLSGALVVTGAGNTIDTTTGRALNVTNTDIGALDLTFQRISSNGAINGIVLDTTGNAGGLVVTGDGSANSGGTIQSSTGPGILLNSVGGGVDLTRVRVMNGGDDGIRGSTVVGFTLDNGSVTGNGNAVGESGLDFGTSSVTGLTGTATLTNATVTGNAENNVSIQTNSGTLDLTVSGGSYGSNSATIGNDGILLLANGTGAITADIQGPITFTNNRGDHVQMATDASTTATVTLTIDDATMTTTLPTVLGGGITFNPGGNAIGSITVTNSNIQGAVSSAIVVDSPGSAVTPQPVDIGATITGNTIGTAGTVDSGSAQGNGIQVYSNGAATVKTLITNNSIHQYANLAGIDLLMNDGNGTINATVQGNLIADPGTFAANGILVRIGTTGGTETTTSCVDLGHSSDAAKENSLTGSGAGGGTDIRARQLANTTVRLPGYGGSSADTAAVVVFLQNQNNPSSTPTASATVSGTGGGFIGGAGCTLP